MKKTYVDVPVPATTRKNLVRVECQMCKRFREWKNNHEPPHFPADGRWLGELPNFPDLTVAVELNDRSHIYDGSGTGTLHVMSAEVCPDCFKGKVIPWLKENGVDIEEREIDL
jgi:hypothetical protein